MSAHGRPGHPLGSNRLGRHPPELAGPRQATRTGRSPSPLLILAGVATVLVPAGGAWLWAQFGARVFFETIRAGFAMCFG